MNETLVERFMLSNFFEKGMNNLYNAISFSASVEQQDTAAIIAWQEFYGLSYYVWSEPMQLMVQEYLMGGPTQTKNV